MQDLNNIYPLQAETIEEINKRAEKRSLDKDDILISSQSVCNHIYFLKSGSIKSFHEDEVKDHTTWVYFEDEMLTSWHSYMLQIPSLECFKAIEKSEIISLKREDVNELKTNYTDFVHLLNTYYEFSIGFYDYFLKKLPSLSAKENYQFILNTYPKLIQKASNSDIASIIGVSRETISRIRAQL